MLRSRGAKDILTTVVSQKPFHYTQIYTYNSRARAYRFVKPKPHDEFTKINFVDGLPFTDPLIEKQSGGDPLICYWWFYCTARSMHLYMAILFFQLGLLLSRKEESLMNGCLRLRITVLFIMLCSKKWKGHDIYIIN